MTTPPGWYPDPGHTGNGPALERWWDGSVWTEQTRAPGYPQTPQFMPPQQPPGTGRPKGPLIAGICASVVVVAALIIGSVIVFGDSDDDSKDDKANDKPSASAPEKPDKDKAPEEETPEDPEEPPGEPEPGAPGTIADGVTLPQLGGWQRTEGTAGAAVTIGPYKCPATKEEGCVRGGSAVLIAPEGADDAEALAKADIEPNAEQSYGKEYYGGIESHDELLSEKVSVAGEPGYRVRWKVENKTGPDAYIESVAFEHPDGSGRMLTIRTGFDIHDEAPPLSAMDKLVKGASKGSVTEEDDGDSEEV